ncbi:response regulator [Flavobacterium erciyesense]|jgi:CheY-like chemotaxis protein|uniref:response regulator n=1 Tax=Flavobacterium erciyesense TaxID=2825842 RepID=UPI001CECDEE5|nr:response regulator [Flavobacterium erciyesense]
MITKKSIWIVDDDPIYQIIANKIIQRSDMFSEVTTFKNGREAMNIVHQVLENKNTIPDIILLDINMPVMDGWEFMEELTAIKPQIQKEFSVYIVSSSIAVEDKSKSKKYNDILGYLSKPISVNDLLLIALKDE